MVQSQTRRNFPDEQQVSSGAVHRPELDPDKFIEKESSVHEQVEGEELTLAEWGDAELESRAD